MDSAEPPRPFQRILQTVYFVVIAISAVAGLVVSAVLVAGAALGHFHYGAGGVSQPLDLAMVILCQNKTTPD